MQDANNLVWIDMEMTGLDPARDVVLEVATLVTDANLEVLAEGPECAVRRADGELAGMDEWNQQTHGASGLLERVAESEVAIDEAERRTLQFIKEWVPHGVSPLCGNSVHQDRRFLRREMPQIEDYLHYRIIDVSTLKELVRRWYPEAAPPAKRETHRALDDIRESIAELRWYRDSVFKASASGT